MNYFFTEEQEMIRDLARKIAVEKIKPVRTELDEKSDFPTEVMKELARADLLRAFLPEAYGGMGGGATEMCIISEEISRICPGVGATYGANGLAATPIIFYGSDEQKKRFLPRIADGEAYAAFALTEANAGSDAGGIKTTAKEVDDGFIVNGTKQFITNGEAADIYSVVVMTNPEKGPRGASILVIEKGTPGFEFGKEENKMGIRASKTTQLIFNDCKVPKENLLGKKGMGFIIAMKTFDRTRPGVAAQAVGTAQGSLDEAIAYARERHQFGKPITAFQGVQFMLADMGTQIEAARALLYATTRMIDAGERNFARESAMVKLFATDMAMKVTTDAVQIMGGYGYMKEYPVEKFMRDAKILQIYEGTNQIQRSIIASHLIK